MAPNYIMTFWYQLKLILIFVAVILVYHGLRFTDKSNCYIKNLQDKFHEEASMCPNEKHLIIELQRRLETNNKQIEILKEHNKLLVRKLKSYEVDQAAVEEAEKNKINEEISNANERFKRDGTADDIVTPSFPEDIGIKAISGARPCCTALKRMTDILRTYMKAIRSLRHGLRECRDNNATQYLSKSLAEKSCTYNLVQFHNLSSRHFHTNYLTIGVDNATIYEAIPDTSQPFKLLGKDGSSFIKYDFKEAYKAATQLTLPVKSQSQIVHLNSLQRFNPLRGIEYEFHVKTQNGRIYEIPLVKSFSSYQIDGAFKDLTLKNKELINIIVPLSAAKYDRLRQFLGIIEDVCIKNEENIFLTFVIYDKRENALNLKRKIRLFCNQKNLTKYDIFTRDLPFSRGGALHDGVLRWNGDEDALFFFCDIDITFNLEFLQRCRLNSEKERKVYFPILFSLYNPKFIAYETNEIPNDDISSFTKAHGKWRTTGFGMICVHRSDYLAVGGFNLKLQGWGGEDTNLHKRFVRTGYSVIRAPDPGVFHRWHPKKCDKTRADKKRYNECLGAKARFEGSQRQLGMHIFQREEDSL